MKQKIRAAIETALEMLRPVEGVDRATLKREVLTHPYVVGFIAAFCTTAASVAFENRHTEDDTSRVIEAVYERLFEVAPDELTRERPTDTTSAGEGWDNAMLILKVIRGVANSQNDMRVAAALRAAPEAVVAEQGEGPAAVGVLWNEFFVRRLGVLAAG